MAWGAGGQSAVGNSVTFRLYDLIGDYDAAIGFTDEQLTENQSSEGLRVLREAFVTDKQAGVRGRATKVLEQLGDW